MRAACALLLVLLSACGEETSVAKGPAGFEGRFRGEDGEVLTLSEQGDKVHLARRGYTLIASKAAPDRVEGEETNGGEVLRFTLTLEHGDLRMRVFEGKEGETPQLVSDGLWNRLPDVAPSASRDSRLVAHWRHTESRASGPLSYVNDMHLVLEADGTMSTWDKTRSSAGDSDSAKTAGTWKTQDGELFLKPDGVADWASVGRYGLTDTHMMLTVGGSKTVYERL